MEAQAYKPKNQGKKELMGSKLLEALTRTHIAIPITIYVALSAYLMYVGMANGLITGMAAVSTFTVGLLLFTLFEYLTHKHVFHMEPTTKFKEEIQYKFHGVHHDFPKDKGRLAMPPVVSVLVATILFFLFRFLIGNYVFGFLPGFFFGYAAYLFVHYMVHAFRPPKNFFRILWVNHGIHHYKSPDKAFGVSSPLWDYVFKTMP